MKSWQIVDELIGIAADEDPLLLRCCCCCLVKFETDSDRDDIDFGTDEADAGAARSALTEAFRVSFNSFLLPSFVGVVVVVDVAVRLALVFFFNVDDFVVWCVGLVVAVSWSTPLVDVLPFGWLNTKDCMFLLSFWAFKWDMYSLSLSAAFWQLAIDFSNSIRIVSHVCKLDAREISKAFA